MADYDWQCTNFGHQMNGSYGCKPDVCPECSGTDFEDAEAAEEREAENRAINRRDEELEERRNGSRTTP